MSTSNRVRYGWWEALATTHADEREALNAALGRSVDVDEDTGAPSTVSLPRLGGRVHLDLAATTAAASGLYLRTNPRGWELVARPTLVGRLTRGHLSATIDACEELLAEGTDPQRVLVHVLGPWSFGAVVEHGGHPLVADRPAFKDVALTLGEGVAQWCGRVAAATGVEVHVVMHEPLVAGVVAGLPGPTPWDEVAPVDPQIVAGVWRRFVDQVGVPVVLQEAPVRLASRHPEVFAEAGVARVGFPLMALGETWAKDAVAGVLQQSLPVALVVDVATVPTRAGMNEVERRAAGVARQGQDLWRGWTFEAGALPQMVDVSVQAGLDRPVSAAAASTAAAVARLAAQYVARG